MTIPKILIVDDEPDILEFISYNLRKEGYEVCTAANGREGLSVAQREQPQLVILDIMMPELNGIEVCAALRKDPAFAHTIIVFLTARNEDFTQIAALDAGGDDFVTKPIRPRVFVSRIKALLRRIQTDEGTASHLLQLGDLRIDFEQLSVQLHDVPIELARKEFEILTLLVSKPGKVFRREEIYSKIWGSAVIVGDRTLDVHIRKLREKIGDTLIKTIKGVGYKFEF